MLIKGKQVYLEHFSPAHLDDAAYYEWLKDVEVVRYIGRDELLRGVPFAEVENYVRQLWANKLCTFLAVHHTESGRFIGTAKINFVSEYGYRHGIADIGIMIGDRYFWGKGLATDVLLATSIFAFDSLNARKLSCGAFSLNVAVVKAFLRIGYKIDGRLREQLAVDGEYCDHVLMSCFRHELIRT